ncbi:MAG: hypothetical protein KAI28_09815 [Sphingomonadales bacterium]|nr:hypothetical protein [Sphingomonadales bacterium]
MDALNESETRFLAAVERLSKAASGVQEQKVHMKKVEAENKILAGGLAQLKADYQALEKAFGDLKTHVETREFATASEGSTSDQEVAALRDQLAALQAEHNGMEDDFSTLKKQYAETLESSGVAPLLPFGVEQKDVCVRDDDGNMDAFRDALRERLDTAIERLERLSA